MCLTPSAAGFLVDPQDIRRIASSATGGAALWGFHEHAHADEGMPPTLDKLAGICDN
jgi:hypothetical protein